MDAHLVSQSDPLSFYAAAAARTLRQFIEALWFEGVLQGQLGHQSDGKRILTLSGVNEMAQRVEYVIAVLPRSSFRRDRLSGSVIAQASGKSVHDIAQLAGDLLRPLALPNTPRFIHELIHTAAKEAYSMQVVAQRKNQEDVLHLPYAWQEAQLGEGHLYHPCFRSRMGFSVSDHQQYGPEFARPFALVWLAIDVRLTEVHTMLQVDYASFLRAEMGAEEYARLQYSICEQDRDADAYNLMPVHPWHWRECLQIQFADWLADGRLLYLGEGKESWLAQQSIRSLSSLADSKRHHVKLPLAIANSSAERILSDHHVHNAPRISQWLQALCANDAYLQQHCRLAILLEPIGITLKSEASRQDRYGLLGAIWRQSPAAILEKGEQIFPCTALTGVDAAGRLQIAPWLQQHGTEVWVHAFLHAILPPLLHLMSAHGVLLEAHAQNTLLIVKAGMPCGIAVRDLPGGLHYIAGQTTGEKQLHHLRAAPDHRNRANASNGFTMKTREEARDYLLEVLLFIHLSEFAHRLELHHGFSEQAFWKLAVQVVSNYQSMVPELSAVIAQFELFVPHIQLEKLASRRLSAASTQEFHRAPNPLFEHSQKLA